MKSICIVLVAGAVACASMLPASAMEPAKEKVLHSFCNEPHCGDGRTPLGALTAVNGLLYGTTAHGGAYGKGTAFALDPATNVEKVLYSFCGLAGCTDGESPKAGLIDVSGTLYGTTYRGGAHDSGTVFALDPNTGQESVIYSFCGRQDCADGAYPQAGLIDVKGALYGTTSNGGGTGAWGTVFSVDPNTGTEKVLHAFSSSGTDGYDPFGGVIDVNGSLYGTTFGGGVNHLGTVYAVDPDTGTETAVYAFAGGADGYYPTAGLVTVKGDLYGTTVYGGDFDEGTAFSLDPGTGTHEVLYSFCSQQSCSDGARPNASMIAVGDTLYGTTGYVAGAVFSLSRRTGAEKVVYAFPGGRDGNDPRAGVIYANGMLYGTTMIGGRKNDGTVFVLTTP